MSKLSAAEWRELEYASQQESKIGSVQKKLLKVQPDFSPHKPGDIVSFHDTVSYNTAVFTGADNVGHAILMDAQGFIHIAKFDGVEFRCFTPLNSKIRNGYKGRP